MRTNSEMLVLRRFLWLGMYGLYTSVVPQLTLVTSRLCLACRHTSQQGVRKKTSNQRHDTQHATWRTHLEEIEELLEGDVALIDDEVVPQGPALGVVLEALGRVGLVLGAGHGLRLDERGQRQVDERVAVALNGHRRALDDLVQLEAHEAGDHGRGGGDGRDDAASDLLGLVEVGRLDLVVGRTQVRRLCSPCMQALA